MSDTMINHLKRITKILLFLAVFLACTPAFSDSKNDSKTSLSVQVTASGTPSSGIPVYAATYQQAYEAITKGEFSSAITNSSSWTAAQTEEGTIQVAGYQIGNGLKHTDAQAISIIAELFRTSYNLLQTINDSNNGIFGTFTAPSNFVQMNFPGAPKKQYTNADGVAEAKVKIGLVAIVGAQQNLLDLEKVTDKTGRIVIDTNSSQGLSININNLQSNKTGASYTVDFGQKIEYILKLKKELLSPNVPTLVSLKPAANIVIDSTSIPNNKGELVPPLISSPITFDSNAGKNQLAQVAQKIGDTYIPQQINSYDINVPYTGQDVEIKVEAHLAATVYLDRAFQQNTSGASPNGTNLHVPINAYDLPDNNFGLSVSAYPTTGEIDALAPSVNSSGINFVQTDAGKDKMVAGASYLLGKKIGNISYLYSAKNGWQQVGSLSAVNPQDYLLLKGGNKYIISQETGQAIAAANSRFNYNAKNNKAVNQSLIQIFGLGSATDYFLYQVSSATGYPLDKTPIDFSVFRTYGGTPNGQPLTKSSVGFAKNQSYKINGQIPDYATGVNEYNILPVTAQKTVPFSVQKSIVAPLIGLVVAMGLIAAVLVKVF